MIRKGHLFEKICSYENLIRAAYKASRGKLGKVRVARFMFNLEFEVLRLHREMLNNKYYPSPYKSFFIYEPKRRHICAADFRDRVVHHAICNYLEPIFERMFVYDSYACRKGKGAHSAVKRVQRLCTGNNYFLKADIEQFFASINHEILKALLKRKIKDSALLGFLDRIIDLPFPGQVPGKGLPIGNLTSQWWANFYLDRLDHFIKDTLGVKICIRYMDDFIILALSKEELHYIRAAVRDFLRENLQLTFKKRATYIAPIHQGIPFLGFRIFPGVIRLKHESLIRFRRRFNRKEKEYLSGQIDEDALIRHVAGVIGHVRHANSLQMRRKFFSVRYGGIGA